MGPNFNHVAFFGLSSFDWGHRHGWSPLVQMLAATYAYIYTHTDIYTYDAGLLLQIIIKTVVQFGVRALQEPRIA